MTDVRWIKIQTDIFDNRKTKIIEAMPDGDTILVIWFKLLCLAATTNDGGLIYVTRDIPYTPETLSVITQKPLATVRLALQTFTELEMIEVHDDFITLPGWEEYQNIDGLEKIREQARIRAQRYRDNHKAPKLEDKTTKKEADSSIYKEVVDYLNERAGTAYRPTTKKTQTLIHARTSEGFTLDDFKTVIDSRCAKWKGTDYEQYLRPETLFGTKFEGYLNAKTTAKKEINAPVKRKAYPEEFEHMWSTFPGHDYDNKEDAYESYSDAIADGATPAQIRDALSNYMALGVPYMSGRSFFGGAWKQHK